jgi:hypothetical protein
VNGEAISLESPYVSPAFAKIEFEVQQDGLVDLGPMNGSAVGRLATYAEKVAKLIAKDSEFQLPRSQFARFVAERITGEDKQDMSMIISGRKGFGKSRSSLYIAYRVAKEIALVLGGNWQDYFSLKTNCALLEDTDGINKLAKTVGKHQVILIDDAGVAVGSRDFATTKNKNFNTLLTICRTRRWFIIFNVPVRTHVDKQIRELVDCVARVYKPYHKKGFNILKVHSVEISETNFNKPYSHRYSFNNKKVDMWVAFNPPQDMVDAYEEGRDSATDRIIMASITGDEGEPLPKREVKFQKLLTEVFDTIKQMDDEGCSKKDMLIKCKQIHSEHMLNRVLASVRE